MFPLDKIFPRRFTSYHAYAYIINSSCDVISETQFLWFSRFSRLYYSLSSAYHLHLFRCHLVNILLKTPNFIEINPILSPIPDSRPFAFSYVDSFPMDIISLSIYQSMHKYNSHLGYVRIQNLNLCLYLVLHLPYEWINRMA